MSKVVCFGELLLRMSPMLQGKWIKDASIPVFVGGAELNVAIALANWQIDVEYCTALPNNYLTEEISEYIQSKNVGTNLVQYGGERIGIYYLPIGSELKNAGVIYDRAHSSFSKLSTGSINWNIVLSNCNWFHFSAITPALNENLVSVCEEALQEAKKNQSIISIDLNYRNKLWQYGKQPKEIMPQLVKHCNIVMGNIWAAENLLGIPSGIIDSENATQEELIEAAKVSMHAMQQQYTTVTTIAYTFRMQKDYFAVLLHQSTISVSKTFAMEDIVDKVGSGDCFMAALIYGITNNHEAYQIINFASAAAIGKLKEKGDSTSQTICEINKRLA